MFRSSYLLIVMTSMLFHEASSADEAHRLTLQLRNRIETQAGSGEFQTVVRSETWDMKKTAIIVCDMWDAHHCLNAVRRGTEMAPRVNEVLCEVRKKGGTVIHAPSSCMEFYKDHPARQRAKNARQADDVPAGIEQWCHWIDEREEKAGYPIDHSDGGEDDDPEEHKKWHQQLRDQGRNPNAPWIRQMEQLEIQDEDYITDNGVENWNILTERGIDNVILVGVHTNMCVLGRPFGLRQMAKNGKNVVLLRDLTDTMYNPAREPKVSHFEGTDLIIQHVEQFVCPTITSNQLAGSVPFRFSTDPRKHIVMLVGEQEYQTQQTLPRFADQFLMKDFRVTLVQADSHDINHFAGIEAVSDADLLLVSVRRRTPPAEQLVVVREYLEAGKPVVGIRTASHAFSLRSGDPPAGHIAWPEFDQQVLGGNYHGHHGNKGTDADKTFVWTLPDAARHPILKGIPSGEQHTTSHLYKTSPLVDGTHVLMMGRVGERKPHEPVSWTFTHFGGGRSFYTSLGNPDDFADRTFQKLLLGAIYWACEKEAPK